MNSTKLTHSSANGDRYLQWMEGRLARKNSNDSIAPLANFVHSQLRSMVLQEQYSCVAARAAFNQGTYRFSFYGEMGDPLTTAALAEDLERFVAEQPKMKSDFTTFVASFPDPVLETESGFEGRLWTQLQSLADMDDRPWDQSVASDPEDAHFSFSFGGEAFFVVGLHPASSRYIRRFAWPTLVFNSHQQFENLRNSGKFERMQQIIRHREEAIQGNINPNLTNFGEDSEARQYSGRAVAAEWKCPFHKPPKAA